MMYADKQPVSLVLGGGGGRGLAHIGAWRALEELGVTVERVVGTSVGALIGAAIASGLGWEELAARARSVARGRLFSLDPRLLYRGMDNPSLLRGEPFRALIRELVPVNGFDQLRIPLAVNAIDLQSGQVAWFGEGGRADVPLVEAVYASCALPLLLPPAAIDGRLYVDGGIIDAVPVGQARALGASAVLAVDFSSDGGPDSDAMGFAAIYRRVFNILRGAPAGPAEDGAGVVRIRPDVAGRTTFDLSRPEELIEAGYSAVFRALTGRDAGTGAAGRPAPPSTGRRVRLLRVLGIRALPAQPAASREREQGFVPGDPSTTPRRWRAGRAAISRQASSCP